MADIFGTQPPAWLVGLSQPDAKGLGRSVGTLLGGAMGMLEKDDTTAGSPDWLESRKGFQQGMFEARMNMLDPMWRLKEEHAKLGLYNETLRIQQAQNMIDLTKLKMVQDAQDNQTLPAWITAYPTWDARQDAPVPPLKTKAAWEKYHQIKQDDSRSFQAFTAEQSVKAFDNRVAELTKLDPEGAGAFAQYIGKVPSADISKAVDIALAAARLAQKNTQESDILASGLPEAKVTVGPTGVTKTYENPKTTGGTTYEKPLEVMVFGKKAVYNRKSDSVKFVDEGGKSEEWSVPQLQKMIDVMPARVSDPNNKSKMIPNPERAELAKMLSDLALVKARELSGKKLSEGIDTAPAAPTTSAPLKYQIVPR